MKKIASCETIADHDFQLGNKKVLRMLEIDEMYNN